jgi:tape measure domain-containing protein
MAEPLTIAITATGALVVQRSLQAIGRAAVAAAQDVDLLSAAFAALAATEVFSKLGAELNSLQNMRNQLAVVTNSTEELTQAQDALLKVAQQTRTPFDDTVNVFARVKRATEELGVSSAEAIRIVKTLNEALIVGGASGQERRSTIYQFTQALASGRLGGDELRSLLENAPVLTQALAKHFDTTIGQLRNLGKQGKLTTAEIVTALREMSGAMDETFSRTTVTIDQAFTLLRNSFDGALLQFDRMYDASGKVTGAIMFLADHADTLTRLVVPGALALASAFIAARVAGTSLTSVVAGLFGTLLINPFTAWIVGIGSVIALLYSFRDEITLAYNSNLTLAELVKSAWIDIKVVIQEAQEKFGEFRAFVEQWLRDNNFKDFHLFDIRQWLFDTGEFVDKTVDEFTGLRDAIAAIWHSLPSLLMNDLLEIVNGFKNLIVGTLNAIEAKLHAMDKYLPFGGSTPLAKIEIPDAKYDPQGNLFQNAANAYLAQRGKSHVGLDTALDILQRTQAAHDAAAGASAPGNALGGIGNKLNQQNQPDLKGEAAMASIIANAWRDANQEMNQAQNLLYQIAQKTSIVDAAEIELAREEKELEKAQAMGLISGQRKAELLATMKYRLQDNLDPQAALIRNVQEEIRFVQMSNSEREIQNQLLQEEIRLRKQGVEFTRKDEYEQDLRKLQQLRDISQAVQNTFQSMLSTTADAIANFVKTGKLNFEDLISSIISDIVRLVLELTIVQPLMKSVFGGLGIGGGGGGGDFMSQIFGWFGGGSTGEAFGGGDFIGTDMAFANGGSFDVGGSGGVDSQLVAFRATPGENVRVGQENSGPSVVIYDQRTSSSASPVQTQRGYDANGKEQLRIFIRDVTNENIESGQHDNAMMNSYGAVRRGRQA